MDIYIFTLSTQYAATHILLIGSEATLDFNIDPEGKVYPDRKRTNGGENHGIKFMLAKEYPPESGLVVACGGLDSEWLSVKECERYSYETVIYMYVQCGIMANTA